MGDLNKAHMPRTAIPPALQPPDLALHSAVSRGDIGSICYALLGGQPIDSLCDGLQPIHVAATQDDPAVIEMLLQNGADPNARSVAATKLAPHTSLLCPESAKSPRKHYQRGLRGRGSFSFLKYSGVGPISAPIGFATGLHSMHTACHAADDTAAAYARRMSSETVDLYGGYHGATPLHFAVAGARIACVEALLRGGARTDAADSFGNTPASIAAACGDMQVTSIIWGENEKSFPIHDVSVFENPTALPVSAPATIQQLARDDCAASLHKPVLPSYRFSSREMAVDTCPTQQLHRLPSPDLSDCCPSESVSDTNQCCEVAAVTLPITAVPKMARLSTIAEDPPARRHTAGEADAHLYYGNSRLSPLGGWIKTKHRDTSPIGIRTLSVGLNQRYGAAAAKRSTSISGRLAKADIATNIQNWQTKEDALVRDFVSLHRPAMSGSDGLCVAGPHSMEIKRPDMLSHADKSISGRNDNKCSRRERSYTDSVIERAWRSYLEHDDEKARDCALTMAATGSVGYGLRPLPELWMWKQAAIAVRNRRSQSLMSNARRPSSSEAEKRLDT
ncbi:hypothetical protein H4S08_000804 [Coemansia sp. RSA 1365]|nr:hypothetical protein H4S08_000804 [Coemansia sp. RSA 1365]